MERPKVATAEFYHVDERQWMVRYAFILGNIAPKIFLICYFCSVGLQ